DTCTRGACPAVRSRKRPLLAVPEASKRACQGAYTLTRKWSTRFGRAAGSRGHLQGQDVRARDLHRLQPPQHRPVRLGEDPSPRVRPPPAPLPPSPAPPLCPVVPPPPPARGVPPAAPPCARPGRPAPTPGPSGPSPRPACTAGAAGAPAGRPPAALGPPGWGI